MWLPLTVASKDGIKPIFSKLFKSKQNVAFLIIAILIISAISLAVTRLFGDYYQTCV